MRTRKMRTSLALSLALVGVLGAGSALAADEVKAADEIKAAEVKAPVLLSDAQMEQVVAGGLTLVSPGNDINSCNSGKCFYENPNGKVVGKPVRGFNN